MVEFLMGTEPRAVPEHPWRYWDDQDPTLPDEAFIIDTRGAVTIPEPSAVEEVLPDPEPYTHLTGFQEESAIEQAYDDGYADGLEEHREDHDKFVAVEAENAKLRIQIEELREARNRAYTERPRRSGW